MTPQQDNGGQKMSRYDQSTPVSSFDPQGDGYDYQAAIGAGASPDESKHWQSLDPRTGMVLKGRNHETWDLMVEEEEKLGNAVVKRDDGRYQSIKQDRYTSSHPSIEDEIKDTPDNWAERANKDYNFSVENNVEFGFGDAVKREWATPSGLSRKIPISGGWIGFAENVKLTQAAKRLNGFDYSKSVSKAPPGKENVSVHRPITYNKEADMKLVSDQLKYITADKTTMAKIAEGVSVLPTWFLEFAATGGLASLGDDIARKGGEKILGAYAKTATGKVALRTAGWSSGAFTRSFGLVSQVGEKHTKQTMDEVLGLKEETGWGTKLARAWGDVYIEALSESLFGASGTASLIDEGLILKGLKKLPFGKKFIPALEKSWIKATSGTKAQFIKKMNSKGGYSNILGEVGEERLGTTLRAISNVEDFGLGEESTMIERLKAGTVQDIENIWVELGVLAFPAAAHTAGAVILDRDKADRIRTEIGAKSEEITKQEAEAVKIRGMIESEIEKAPDEADLFGDIAEEAAKAGDTTKEASPEAIADELPRETGQEGVIAPKPAEGKPEAAQVAPTRVEDANLNNEVDNVVGQLMTNRADPSKTSLKQEDIQEGRKILGLDGVPSQVRQARLKTLQEAKDGGYVEDAEENANRALNSGEPLSLAEEAGVAIRMVQSFARYNAQNALLAKATEPLAIASLGVEIERLISRYDLLSSASHKTGSSVARQLAFRKTLISIDENYNFLAVQNRLKRKRGKPPTMKQTEQLKKLTDELEQKDREIARLQKEVADAMAKDFLDKGKVARYGDMNRSEILFERDSLLSRIAEMEEC